MSKNAAWTGDAGGAPLSRDEQLLVSGQVDRSDDELMEQPPVRSHGHAHQLIIAATIGLLILIWWAVPVVGLMNPVLISNPIDTVQGLWSLVTTGDLVGHFTYTMAQVLAGFALGVVTGMLLGTALALIPVLDRIFTPYILAVRSLPIVVLAPLFITWFGFGVESKLATAVTICFLPTMINTMVGLRIPGADSLSLMRALDASRWQVYRKLRLPAALPLIFVGVKHSLLLSFTGVLLAEILLGGSTKGLGTLVRLYSHQIRMDLVFGVVIVLTILSVLLVMMFDRLDRRFIFWREEPGETR